METELTLRTRLETLKNAQGFDLETKLEAMRSFGNPRLSFDGDGWYCAVDMHIPSKGCTFKVASDFSMVTTHKALNQCASRIIETMNQYL